jgi:hypothetical protein
VFADETSHGGHHIYCISLEQTSGGHFVRAYLHYTNFFFLLVVSTFQATDKILWLPIVGSSQIIINIVKEIKIRST